MTRSFYADPALNRMDPEEIRRHQESKLPAQLKYCYEHSEFYRQKFDDAGAKPEDIRTLEDLRKLPVFMVKDDERRSAELSLEKYGHPFGLHLCAPVEDIYLTGTTSGTTGMPTFSYTFTKKDMEFLAPRIAARMALAGVGKGDRVAFFFALGIYATTMTLWGLRRLGALPIDIDARAGTELFLKFIGLTRPTYIACTPSLAEYLIIKAPLVTGKEVGDFGLKGILTTGEIGIALPGIKKKIESAYGCRSYDYWAPCGNAPGISCDSDEYHGLHAIAPDLCTSYDDLVDPVTKEPVDSDSDGAVGEMVHTNLQREACPAVKYAYGDIVRITTKECPGCGFRGKRAKLVGRADDMLIVKGVNVYPAAIRDVVAGFVPDVTGELRIVLESPPPRVVPPLKLKIAHGAHVSEADLPGLSSRIAQALHDAIKIRPEIRLVGPEDLPKETRKTPVFEKIYEE
ncbi:MAG: phenylacetate--CoA ligase family protein [Deltaproteobacteria bacterium]|nr:phenylacetate--CoA ligase family protein [Deltaproteobacteria bacterium]MBW1950256.1 phenylacetate--CoA ligase family protein [Deltaproteobacteria bacterium]MBW2009779.1 phenylacetate--CoA ligase family protein [Deltaproteobacteria bacterium]MBW2346718.1 phenylacetate--CoA ligase family protein [Deltaproteobacteria bacterium]RLB35058.1 MAG: phenylacetate--CoA ligase family protein [Deltaproteobacteria bacterium]